MVRGMIHFLLLSGLSLRRASCMRGSELADAQELEVLDESTGKDCPAGGGLWRAKAGGLDTGGVYGKIIEVQEVRGNCGTKSSPQAYVLKAAYDVDNPTGKVPKFATDSIKSEVKAMVAAKDCPGVMSVFDAKPCLEKGGKRARNCDKMEEWKTASTAAFVMPKMDGGTLDNWLQLDYQLRPLQKNLQKCAMGLAQQLYDALLCLHTAGYIHGDLKPDNVFLSKVPSSTPDACPGQLWLADLGLVQEIGTAAGQYGGGYAGSTHLPAGMFEDAPAGKDSLGITAGQEAGKFYVKADIDLCSFDYMLDGRLFITSSSFEGLPTNCGPMGARS